MGIAATTVIVYGIFTIVGGVIGFVKANSRPSLFAGLTAGLLLLACSHAILSGHTSGLIGSAVIALLLGGRFFGTWRKQRRLMPDLLMVVLSALTLASVLVALSAGF